MKEIWQAVAVEYINSKLTPELKLKQLKNQHTSIMLKIHEITLDIQTLLSEKILLEKSQNLLQDGKQLILDKINQRINLCVTQNNYYCRTADEIASKIETIELDGS
jgi:hypothetical protein